MNVFAQQWAETRPAALLPACRRQACLLFVLLNEIVQLITKVIKR